MSSSTISLVSLVDNIEDEEFGIKTSYTDIFIDDAVLINNLKFNGKLQFKGKQKDAHSGLYEYLGDHLKCRLLFTCPLEHCNSISNIENSTVIMVNNIAAPMRSDKIYFKDKESINDINDYCSHIFDKSIKELKFNSNDPYIQGIFHVSYTKLKKKFYVLHNCIPELDKLDDIDTKMKNYVLTILASLNIVYENDIHVILPPIISDKHNSNYSDNFVLYQLKLHMLMRDFFMQKYPNKDIHFILSVQNNDLYKNFLLLYNIALNKFAKSIVETMCNNDSNKDDDKLKRWIFLNKSLDSLNKYIDVLDVTLDLTNKLMKLKHEDCKKEKLSKQLNRNIEYINFSKKNILDIKHKIQQMFNECDDNEKKQFKQHISSFMSHIYESEKINPDKHKINNYEASMYDTEDVTYLTKLLAYSSDDSKKTTKSKEKKPKEKKNIVDKIKDIKPSEENVENIKSMLNANMIYVLVSLFVIVMLIVAKIYTNKRSARRKRANK
jgi:hypothetical protein